MKTPKLTLHSRITLLFSLITIILLFIIYFPLKDRVVFYTMERLRASLSSKISLSKSIFDDYIKINDMSFRSMDSLADKMARDLGLRVSIINLSGVLLGDSELKLEDIPSAENHLYRVEVQEALKTGRGESRRFSTTTREDFLYMTERIFRNQQPVGVLRVAMPLSEVNIITSQLKRVLVINFVIILCFSLVLNFLLVLFISRPLNYIAKVAGGIAAGNFSERIAVKSKDEIGDLARAFNEMAEHIEDKIKESASEKSKLEAVLLSMSEGVIALDSSGAIMLMNQSLRDLLRVERNPVGKRPLEVIRNLEVHEILEMALSTADRLLTKEIAILTPEEKRFLVHSAPIKRAGVVEGVVTVFHDITELRHLEKIRQDFVANVSHELRTPMTSIKGYAETLLDGAMDDREHAREFLQIIYAESDRLALLIGDILDLSKVESGKMKMVFKPCALDEIIRKVIAKFAKQSAEKKISLRADLAANLSLIQADEERIAQVMFNLVDNAIKYTPAQGEILVSAFNRDDKRVEVQVKDSGIGIPAEDIDRVFERFYRVDKARSREMGGTGLGLAIVKHILQAHGGDISVESVLSQGSVFKFTLLAAA